MVAEYDDWIKIYPVEEDKKTISSVFSRAPYFAVVRGRQTPGKLIGIYSNPYRDTAYGASRAIVDYLMRFNPNEIVVKNIGRNAEFYFRQLGVLISKVR